MDLEQKRTKIKEIYSQIDSHLDNIETAIELKDVKLYAESQNKIDELDKELKSILNSIEINNSNLKSEFGQSINFY
jgi:mevalonate kinase